MTLTTTHDIPAAATTTLERPPERPPSAPPPRPGFGQMAITTLIVGGPLVGLVAAVVSLWGHGVGLRDVLLTVFFYYLTGHGVTFGFHRMFTHRGYRAQRWLKITAAVIGSMAFEGSVIGWVANHRRHHAYTDLPGDPHSPYAYGEGLVSRLRGFGHAHCGWFFQGQNTDEGRWAKDLLADRDLAVISRLFPVFCVVSLALPAAIGGVLGHSWAAFWSAFLWAGLVRVALLHHVTWAVNSVCHTFGSRPYRTRETDRATNFVPLALVAFGESWHNAHHANPRMARHGVGRGHVDSTARIIRICEQLGWVSDVVWPGPDSVTPRSPAEQRRQHRRAADQEQAADRQR